MEPQLESLLEAASRSFLRAGNFYWQFARGKLRLDPVFFELLRRGCVPDRGHLLDLGCGQGILLSLLAVAREEFQCGRWPRGWPAPPLNLKLRGIELSPVRVRAARTALDGAAQVDQGDLRNLDVPPCSVAVLLDVLLYLGDEEQLRVLEQVARSLDPGGLLLVREADAGAGFAFQVTRWSERLLEVGRGHLRNRLHYRSALAWSGLLEKLGLAVNAEPMSAGTPFANVLFLCRKRGE